MGATMAVVKKVPPRILKGTRDFLPERMILRQWVIGTWRGIFERFGFEPLETPVIEYAETMEGKFGEEGDRLMYRFEDRGGRAVALRYDLTVPLTRVVAMYPDLPKPFKRYHIAPVYRAENPQKGRYREFYQCDVDTVGSTSPLADAEAVTVAAAAFDAIGFPNYTVRLNTRKILAALADVAGVAPDLRLAAFRAIDKLEKVGPERARAEMREAGIADAVADHLHGLVRISGAAREMLGELRGRLADHPLGLEGIAELEAMVDGLDAAGVSAARYLVDYSMVRGMDYYTGPIFETTVEEPKIGSVSGGGRYDKLVGLFSSTDLPATGVSLGLERIIDVIEELGLRPAGLGRTVVAVLVTIFEPATQRESVRIATELRGAGIPTELYLGSGKLPAQLRHADRKGVPLAVIAGPDELAAGTVVLKDMLSGEQSTVQRADLPAAVRTRLDGSAARRRRD